ncbi:hypothetical protein ACIRO1_34765 [Streptomyces sp. NPDC102381]|uniref:hypothetical protein n=1 Tax=Streptomyces sp. NPDC102381 TaxID=3366164 RepID=UPI00382F7DC4
MEPYGALDAIDVFAAATRAFECLKGTLATARTAVLAHRELEELIEVEGRELLRLLFQAHLDGREHRERERTGHHDREPVRGRDGQVRPHCERGHSRLLACVFGTVTVTRTAWRGKGLASVHPADAALSLPARLHSHGLRRLAVLEAVRGLMVCTRVSVGIRHLGGSGTSQVTWWLALTCGADPVLT